MFQLRCNPLNFRMSEDKMLPLEIAAAWGNMNAVKRLLRDGADPMISDAKNRTVAFHALLYNQIKVYQHLKTKMKGPPRFSDEQRQALWSRNIAKLIQTNDLETLKSLIHTDPEITKKAIKDSSKIIIDAAVCSDRNTMRFLIEQGIHFKSIDASQLHIAASNGQKEMFEILIHTGIPITDISEKNRPILHSAARSGNLDLVKLLIENGFNPHTKTPSGANALADAVYSKNGSLVRYLIDLGVEINFDLETIHENPLLAALKFRSEEMVTLLITSWKLQNPDKIVFSEARERSVLNFFDTGIEDTRSIDSNDNTTNMRLVACLERLLGVGLNPNTVYKNKSLLSLFAQAYLFEAIPTLIKAGADPNSLDGGLPSLKIMFPFPPIFHDDDSTYTILNFPRMEKTIETLLQVGSDPNKGSPLHGAVAAGFVGATEILLRAGADPYLLSETQDTAFCYAVYFGHYHIVKVILNHTVRDGYDRSKFRKPSEISIQDAQRSGHEDIAALIRRYINEDQI